MLKQPVLKPQDLVVSLYLCVESGKQSYAAIADALGISASEAHGSVKRARASRLLRRTAEGPTPNRASLREFLIHGAKYTFPLVSGGLNIGMPTGISAAPLNRYFAPSDQTPIVWPCEVGAVRGLAVAPLFPSVPEACLKNVRLYELLCLIDALRGGAAREQELARDLIGGYLT